jgi:mediator of RNA polymerase II transcription subunit 18
MSGQHYEVALFGEFFSKDLKAILDRITLHSESSHPMHSREIVFEPFDAQLQRDAGNDPVLLRAKKELNEADAQWSVICRGNCGL